MQYAFLHDFKYTTEHFFPEPALAEAPTGCASNDKENVFQNRRDILYNPDPQCKQTCQHAIPQFTRV